MDPIQEFVNAWAGFVGFAFNVVGIWQLTERRVSGWFVQLIANCFWAIYAWQLESVPMAFSTTMHAILNVKGIYSWYKS